MRDDQVEHNLVVTGYIPMTALTWFSVLRILKKKSHKANLQDEKHMDWRTGENMS